jgi:phage internal scaffolding protein
MKRIAENSYAYPDRFGDVSCPEKTLAQQQFAGDADINNIVARAIKTGLLADTAGISARQAIFGDFADVGSYHEALNKVVAAQAAFDALPADVRTRFDNDPAKLMEFMGNGANYKEAVALGLVVPVKDEVKGAAPAAQGPQLQAGGATA